MNSRRIEFEKQAEKNKIMGNYLYEGSHEPSINIPSPPPCPPPLCSNTHSHHPDIKGLTRSISKDSG